MSLKVETVFAGQVVPLWRERWQRHLSFAGGRVAPGCPVVLRYVGTKRLALREKARLQRYGYSVRLVRDRKRT